MTAVEVYNKDEELVWSHQFFQDGGVDGDKYIAGMCTAWDCLRDCADVGDYDGGDVDEDGLPVPYDTEETTGIILEYDSETGWSLGSDARKLGQSEEILDACMVAGLVEKDEEFCPEVCSDDDVVAIAKHIMKRGK
jgi:hypothetical protein